MWISAQIRVNRVLQTSVESVISSVAFAAAVSGEQQQVQYGLVHDLSAVVHYLVQA